jgi:hypothetical protein
VELKKATAHTKEKYLEGEPPKLFRKLDYDRLLAGCRFFEHFDREFNLCLSQPNPRLRVKRRP